MCLSGAGVAWLDALSQGRVEICNEICYILYAYREPHQAVADAKRLTHS